ncbi:hypothetical protein DFH29DRAFT_999672 [Suillus ampliporus]|nr:hypothetical protein DFH29DRAFT_999672 [Suillus ampliporus]
MAKTLCDLQNVNYHSCYHEQFSIAFDTFLAILREVRQRTDYALGREDPKWRATHMCVCCTYKLPDEKPLVPSILVSHDGNNSLKRIASVATMDQCVFHSSYILSHNFIDKFKDKVKHHQHLDDQSKDSAKDNSTSDVLTSCERWKSSAPEHQKTALDIYETTGIFAAACWHGFIIKFCEMVCSGELAKYPLALTDFILDAFGKDIGIGYDVGCTFGKIIRNSPLLGAKAGANQLQVIINSFHGYAHNRSCQLRYHPLYQPGFGIEDLETMEHVFSSSNSVSRSVRYASKFHWAQSIDLHFQQWDDNKYVELSKFILNNYQQVLSIISEFSGAISNFTTSLNIEEDEFERWLETEQEYLDNLIDEPEEHVITCAYIQALIDLQNADAKWQQISASFRNMSSTQHINYSEDAHKTLRLETARRSSMDVLLVNIRTVANLEERLSIKDRWTDDQLDYREALGYMKTHKFRCALDKLQQLVVQRLFKLSKANMSGTGYKLHQQIRRAIKTRSKAIHAALEQYNDLAATMTPPAPHLEWTNILDYAFVSDFELLKHTHSQQDITNEPWMVPGNREIAAKYFKVKRGKEELERLNIESRRLHTAIYDEHELMQAQADCVRTKDPLLAAELDDMWHQRERVDAVHIQ